MTLLSTFQATDLSMIDSSSPPPPKGTFQNYSFYLSISFFLSHSLNICTKVGDVGIQPSVCETAFIHGLSSSKSRSMEE